MRKRDENPIRKWNMISRLQFIELTLNLIPITPQTNNQQSLQIEPYHGSPNSSSDHKL